MNKNNEIVTMSKLISKEYYDQLEYDSIKLQALEEMGVDNWGGYSEAMKIAKKRNSER